MKAVKLAGLGGKFGRFGWTIWQVWAVKMAGLGGKFGRRRAAKIGYDYFFYKRGLRLNFGKCQPSLARFPAVLAGKARKGCKCLSPSTAFLLVLKKW